MNIKTSYPVDGRKLYSLKGKGKGKGELFGNSVLKMLYPSLPDLAKVRNSLLANENINEV
ncbi:MAG: hypothetical protein DSY35_04460 [Desulfurobacterium sp.]|nr:MAG: hypothetical protein DSY35_04460 [Desulfurobacterium sp.]